MADKRRFHNRKPKQDSYKPPFPDEVLAEPIENLSLREETAALLVGAKVTTIGDVVKRCDTDFYKICKFNKKNLLDVKAAVKKRNLFLKPLPVKEVNADPAQPAPDGERRNQPVNTAKPKDKDAPGRKQPVAQIRPQQNQPKNQQNKPQDRQKTPNQPQRQDKKKPEKEAPYVMQTLLARPPKPVKVVIKEESDKYVKINKNGLWGFRDRNSKDMAVPAVYDEVFSFKEELCCVQKDEKFGFINRQGEEVIPLVYDCATSFSEGLACVYKGENCGYIDKENNVVIDFKFDAGTPVIGGECRVKKNGKWGELHIDNPEEIRWII